MIDSHTHLDSTPGEDADIVARAREAGVKKLLTIGTDVENSRAALAAAERFDGVVYAAVGWHPNEAGDYHDEDAAALAELARDPRCRAVGETGLDYFRDHASHEDQARAFAAQIEIARDTGKPLVIHTREADDDTIATLARDAHDVTVILHCFSMPTALRRGASSTAGTSPTRATSPTRRTRRWPRPPCAPRSTASSSRPTPRT